MFHDQSQHVIARAHIHSHSLSTGAASAYDLQPPHSVVAAGSSGQINPVPAVPHSRALDQETVWIDFFVNQYTCSGTTDSKSNMFWIPSNFHYMLSNDSVRFSVQSVGAMAIARLQKSPRCVEAAQKKYSQALLSLASEWRRTISNAQKDMIFFVVLLLGFFEVLASYGPSARKSWIAHLGGVSVLFRNNEDYYCGTPFGARMFFHARSQMILIALQTKTPVAETFAKPNPRVLRAVPPQLKEMFEADILLVHLADLQARCRTAPPSHSLLAELKASESALDQWAASLPHFWRWSTQSINRPSGPWWDVHLHTYASPILEHTWNKVRAALIIVHDLATEMEQRLHGGQGAASLLEPKVQQLVIDICSSGPPCFRPTCSPDTGIPPPLGRIYWIFWPLDVVGSMREAPSELTQWVIQFFERVHQMTGNIRASTMADKLKAGQRNFDVSLSYPSLLNLKK
ncbi:hypothetical protein M409DRAFT_59155 [Zasmidium cellare ATCC 36951]|uniref:Transcription factor domain-containing protein n=1 Tax=Zasmidium cellare ATCC 36951 TaxID=1080233 RepID=A0A6A6C3G4_ZASCE|nr:uncharacterized protein M409DRAFT_59155 [Zasmidium cellare ATCC 36951]KAF2161453.1 hypothetical protein M409DRAFT_59155 [Zasmidium cellare ATCC 36951]